MNPNDVGLRRNLAVALADSGRTDEAIAELRRAPTIDPRNAPSREMLEQLTAARRTR